MKSSAGEQCGFLCIRHSKTLQTMHKCNCKFAESNSYMTSVSCLKGGKDISLCCSRTAISCWRIDSFNVCGSSGESAVGCWAPNNKPLINKYLCHICQLGKADLFVYPLVVFNLVHATSCVSCKSLLSVWKCIFSVYVSLLSTVFFLLHEHFQYIAVLLTDVTASANCCWVSHNQIPKMMSLCQFLKAYHTGISQYFLFLCRFSAARSKSSLCCQCTWYQNKLCLWETRL